MTDIAVRDAGPDDTDDIAATLRDEWHDTVVAAHGELIDAEALPALSPGPAPNASAASTTASPARRARPCR